MLFTEGLDSLCRDEKVCLLAQLNVLTTVNIVNEGVQKSAMAAKNIAFEQAARMSDRVLPSKARRIEEWGNSLDWDPEVINRKLVWEIEALSEKSDDELNSELRSQLCRIANIGSKACCEEAGEAILMRAAHSLQMNTDEYKRLEDLESAVFNTCVMRQIDVLKSLVEEMSASEVQSVAAELGDELENLDLDEMAAVREATGMESVSAEAILSVLKSYQGAPMARIVCDDFGFGSMRFLASLGKAIGFAFGCTFLRGAIYGIDRFMARALSPFIAVLSGKVALLHTDKMLYDELAKFVVAVGHSAVIEERREALRGEQKNWRKTL